MAERTMSMPKTPGDEPGVLFALGTLRDSSAGGSGKVFNGSGSRKRRSPPAGTIRIRPAGALTCCAACRAVNLFEARPSTG